MLIRFFSYFYPPCIGGGEVILQHQAEGLVRRGHTVHVHTTPYTNLNLSTEGPEGHSVEGGVHVHRHRSARIPVRNPWEQSTFTPALFGEAWRRADLLVCVGFPSFHLHWLKRRAQLTGTPLIAQNYVTASFLKEILAAEGGPHKKLRALYWRNWVRDQLAFCRMVIADSPVARAALAQSLSLDNVHYHIGMAVDPTEFDSLSPADTEAVRAELGLGSAPFILAPSRISHQKGADLLLEAVAPLFAQHPQWRVVVAGPVNDDAFHQRVVQLASGLGERVKIVQLPRPKLLALMKGAEVVALPSRGETVGGVVFEGMYAGAVTVVSDAVEAAAHDYLQDGENGLMFPSEDVSALRAALKRAMTQDLRAVRAAGRATVAARFTWEASVARLEAMLLKAAAGRVAHG